MGFMRQTGWDIDILSHHRRGGAIWGICGGYQMLGQTIADPHGIEGPAGQIAGLGLLPVTTTLAPQKALRQITGQALGEAFTGYEMHMGQTTGGNLAPFALLDNTRLDGALSADGRIIGTYCHGLLASTGLRRALLARIGIASAKADHAASVEAALDELARELEQHLDVDGLIALARA